MHFRLCRLDKSQPLLHGIRTRRSLHTLVQTVQVYCRWEYGVGIRKHSKPVYLFNTSITTEEPFLLVKRWVLHCRPLRSPKIRCGSRGHDVRSVVSHVFDIFVSINLFMRHCRNYWHNMCPCRWNVLADTLVLSSGGHASLELNTFDSWSFFSPTSLLFLFLFFNIEGHSFKRSRTESSSQNDIQRVVETQAEEIASLKNEKSNLESSLSNLKTEHEKVVNQNSILKKAVTIQQERQNQAASEIAEARRYKCEAEDTIKKLEQIILSLRYHLQAQPTNPGNDFMGFSRRPPDVYWTMTVHNEGFSRFWESFL